MNAEGRFKYYKVWNKDEWCVSETYIDEKNTCHHHILFQYATKEEAKELADRLNQQQSKEEQQSSKNKRFTYLYDSLGGYKILDEGTVLVDDILQESSAKLLTDTLNNLESDRRLMEQWANGLKRQMKEMNEGDDYSALRDKVINQTYKIMELEKENKRLWRISRQGDTL